MTEYTDNYGLNKYSDGDAANLRDQYNASMDIIDSQLKSNGDKAEYADEAFSLATENKKSIDEINQTLNSLGADNAESAAALSEKIDYSQNFGVTKNVTYFSTYLMKSSDVDKMIKYGEISTNSGGGMVLIVYVKGGQVLRGDITKQFLQQAFNDKITVNCIKFHCTDFNSGTTISQYAESVKNFLQDVKSISNFNTIILFNENLDIANDSQGISLIQSLRGSYQYVGISLSNGEVLKYGNNPENYQVINSCNIIGVNNYVSALAYPTDYNSFVFDNIRYRCSVTTVNISNVFNGKKVVISEYGMLPHVEYLRNTAFYNPSQVGSVSSPTSHSLVCDYIKCGIDSFCNVCDVWVWFTEQLNENDVKFISNYSALSNE